MIKECPLNIEAALKRIEGDQELLKIILHTFIREYPHDLERLSHYINSVNYEKVERLAHRIKGAVSAIGAQKAQEFLFKLENMGKQKNLNSAQEILGKLNTEFQRIKEWAEVSYL